MRGLSNAMEQYERPKVTGTMGSQQPSNLGAPSPLSVPAQERKKIEERKQNDSMNGVRSRGNAEKKVVLLTRMHQRGPDDSGRDMN